MPTPYKILIMGASYGSLLGDQAAAGRAHGASWSACPPKPSSSTAKASACACRSRAARAWSRSIRASCRASCPPAAPEGVDPADYDLVALAMQEPQYRSPGVRELLDAVAKAKVPCMSIMNMPPLPYLARIPGLDADALPRLLHRSDGLGRLRSDADDAVQPRPAGVPSAGGEGQRAAGAAADQLQGGALRVGRAHRDAARARGGHRGRALRRRRRARSSCR